MKRWSKKKLEFPLVIGIIPFLTLIHSTDSLAKKKFHRKIDSEKIVAETFEKIDSVEKTGNRKIASEHNPIEPAAPGRFPVNIFDKEGWKVSFSGFTELDVISDSTRSVAEIAGNGPIDKGSTYAGSNGRTQFSLRDSRMGFSVVPPEVEGVKARGFIEFDLLGFEPSPVPGTLSEAGFYSNPTLRLRHAYMSLEASGWQFFAGQTWTLFGWKPYYFLTPVGVSPPVGLLFERTPELTVIKTLGAEDKLQLGLSVVRPAQRDAVIPRLDVGVRYSMGSRKGGNTSGPTGEIKTQPLSVGLSGTFRDFLAPAGNGNVGSSTHALGSAFSLDINIPIIASSDGRDVSNTLSLTGGYSSGSGYGDQFIGWSGVGQTASTSFTGGFDSPNLDAGEGSNTSTGLQLLTLQSYNFQFQYHLPTEWKTFANLGYGQLSSGNNYLFKAATYNRQEMAFVNLMHDITRQIRIGAEYALQQTYYLSGEQAVNRRAQLSFYFIF